MPARQVEVRDEERDCDKTRRFTVAGGSVMKQAHCRLMVPSQATAEPQKDQACRGYFESNDKLCHRSISMK